jgi:uncharacterized cupredoxin-like copper-binding protein
VAAAAAALGSGGFALLLATSPLHAVSAPAARAEAKVTERDFSISAPKHVRAGEVSLTVTNAGPDTHELLVVRSNGRPLPLRSDGLTVNETRIDKRIVGSLEGGRRQTTKTLRLHLAPGRYLLLCNMAGHYLGGMHTQLVVR